MARARRTDGAVIAITGGARGIGKEIARRLAADGARVAIGDRDPAATAATAAELGVLGLPLDVTSPESFTAFLTSVTDQLGPIEVFVNNAGVMWVGSFDDEPESTLISQIEVNLLGVIRGVRLTAPAMMLRGSGHIVTVASAASLLAPAGEATYTATKHGVYGYLKTVRVEMRRRGVHLSVIMPAVVDTALAEGTATGAAKLLRPDAVANAVARVIARPRFEVSVPGYLAPLARLVNVLPRAVQDGLYRVLVPNQIALADLDARAAYQAQFAKK